MRSKRLRGCLVVAALFTGTSSASAQATDEKTDDKTDNKAAPEKVAQAQEPAPTPPPDPQQPGSSGPATPGPREPAPAPDEQLRKMIEEQVAKSKPKGPSVEFAGYARAGVGLAAAGGKQVCFGLPGADTKWRLGNECDYVIEPQFTGRLVQPADGSNWGIVVMPGLYRTWDDPNPNNADRTWHTNIPAEFRQIYFFGENIPQLAHGRVWGGRRYYDRLHLDINDQFLEIHDSDGAGVEEMNVGPGKLSIAFLMNPNSEDVQVASPTMGAPSISTANLAPFKLTARLTDIKTAPEGSLQIWTAIHGSSKGDDKAPADAGVVIPKPDTLFRLGVYHTLNKILGGSNFVGAKIEYTKNHFLWRAVVQEQMQFNGGHTGVDVIGEFRSTKDRANENAAYATNNWLSLGGRVDHQVSGPFRFLAEAGIDRVFPEMGDAPQLFKVTGCFAINAGDGPGARPTVRLFYTHAFWNDAAKGLIAAGGSSKRTAQVYGDANNGGSIGLQAEAWW
jgi:maltoporin